VFNHLKDNKMQRKKLWNITNCAFLMEKFYCPSLPETPFTRYNLHVRSTRLSNRYDNRFDNRLYRVNGVWQQLVHSD